MCTEKHTQKKNRDADEISPLYGIVSQCLQAWSFPSPQQTSLIDDPSLSTLAQPHPQHPRQISTPGKQYWSPSDEIRDAEACGISLCQALVTLVPPKWGQFSVWLQDFYLLFLAASANWGFPAEREMQL